MGFTSGNIDKQKLAEILGVSVEDIHNAISKARKGGYARIWQVEDKGTYSIASISTGKKNKETDNYDTDFQHKFVRLIGDAHKFAKRLTIPAKGGAAVRINSCEVTNKYDEKKNTTYWNCTVFDLEDASSNGSGNANNVAGSAGKAKNTQRQHIAEPDDDVQLPF